MFLILEGPPAPRSGVEGWLGSAGAGAGQAGIPAELRSFGEKHILPGTIPICPPACGSHCSSLTPLSPGHRLPHQQHEDQVPVGGSGVPSPLGCGKNLRRTLGSS